MRAGLSTIQQTLTPEAANVLNNSIAEAGRRNHGQTTPLHVAATLLASPSGFLRQACIRSHPNSSHPLQCRALELCFSVALERLPTSQSSSPGTEPPISNALMAALKRAQAHQRRGCPEQQQQPLLAVKVELEQLIISILDDPSVSRVMREASFSSPAVKATIEQSMNSQSPATSNPSPIGIGFRPSPAPLPIPNRNLYMNPRLQQGNSGQPGQQRNDEVKRVIDVLLRTKKRNPVLVGESEPEAVVKELLKRIEKGEIGESPLKNVQVIQLEKELLPDKSQIHSKLKELGGLIETRIGSGGIILDLGNFKWLVEQPVGFAAPAAVSVQQVVSEIGGAAVVEMGKLLANFREGPNGRLWLIGTATCETYLRCQVYYPSMENDWDLQALPITTRSPLPGMFPRLGTNGLLSTSVEGFNPLKSFSTATIARPRQSSHNIDSDTRRATFCPQCLDNYEQELSKLVTDETEKSFSEVKPEATRLSLPQWLQNARSSKCDVKPAAEQSEFKDKELLLKQRTTELQKKWSDKCQHLHPNYHRNLNSERNTLTIPPMTGLYNPNPVVRQPFPPKLQPERKLGESLQLNSSNQAASQPLEQACSHPRSPVRTDLVLGTTKVSDQSSPNKAREEPVKDFLRCISSETQAKFPEFLGNKCHSKLEADSFKKLLKGLMEKAWWQPEAASALALAVTGCKLGNGKRRGTGSKGDMWLLFTGPDRVGKKKMASVLSEQVSGVSPIMISMGTRRENEELEMNFRGKTAVDRIAEAVRRNPCSVIMLEDIDEADVLVRSNIRRAMERGRLSDSTGREISLGNVIFILTGNWSTVDPHNFEKRPENWVPCQLRLTVAEKRAKRSANWLLQIDKDRPRRPRKELGSSLSFDLNQAADGEDDRTDGSRNSSDLTVDREDEFGLEDRQLAMTSVPHELVSSADDVIMFKPVDLAFVRREIKKTIENRFSIDVDDKLPVEVDDEVLEKILHGLWHGRASLEEWATKELVPGFQQLKARLRSSNNDGSVVRLEPDSDSVGGSDGEWLPSKITVMVDGA